MNLLHPSLGKTDEERIEAEEKFHMIAEAYEVLSTTELRRKYDNGEEVSNNIHTAIYCACSILISSASLLLICYTAVIIPC